MVINFIDLNHRGTKKTTSILITLCKSAALSEAQLLRGNETRGVVVAPFFSSLYRDSVGLVGNISKPGDLQARGKHEASIVWFVSVVSASLT